MVPRNIGDRFLIRRRGYEWIPLKEAYLTEATDYEWQLGRDNDELNLLKVQLNHVPIPFSIEENQLRGQFITPFQSGEMTLSVDDEMYTTYLYPDSRKMTEQQYEQMLSEILEEASVCFELSGLSKNMDVSGFNREVSWPQWTYIQRQFTQLEQVMRKIQERPYRVLKRTINDVKKERVNHISSHTTRWLEKSYGKGASSVPDYIQTTIREETFDVYENQLLKRQIFELQRLLKLYKEMRVEGVSEYAEKLYYRTLQWSGHPFLKDVRSVSGPQTITQVIRKNPQYRKCYQWFEALFKHGQERVGFEYPIPLKNTYDLYEIWSYMFLVKIMREEGLLKDTLQLFHTNQSGCFLNLSTNHQSKVTLTNNWKLYFQREYRANSPEFHSYTHAMIPDIVLEAEDALYVFDPKYRVPGNLSGALGEMHKYRDGILFRATGEKAVKEVYILTPDVGGEEAKPKFFKEDYHSRYKMGAFICAPGDEAQELNEWVRRVMVSSPQNS